MVDLSNTTLVPLDAADGTVLAHSAMLELFSLKEHHLVTRKALLLALRILYGELFGVDVLNWIT